MVVAALCGVVHCKRKRTKLAGRPYCENCRQFLKQCVGRGAAFVVLCSAGRRGSWNFLGLNGPALPVAPRYVQEYGNETGIHPEFQKDEFVQCAWRSGALAPVFPTLDWNLVFCSPCPNLPTRASGQVGVPGRPQPQCLQPRVVPPLPQPYALRGAVAAHRGHPEHL